MVKVKIGNEVLLAEKGQLLSDVLMNNGISVEHPCGGKGTCKKCRVLVDGREELSCLYRVGSDICVEPFSQGAIISETGASEQGSVKEKGALCLCLDIGTTTLALALVDISGGNILKVKTATNPQRCVGADVMSRIEYCRNSSTHRLQALLVEKINGMIRELGLKNKADLYASGNATMLHILFGVDCGGLGVAPYTAKFYGMKRAEGGILGLDGVNEVISLPFVHSFFGADLTAGMNYAGVPSEGKYNLLVDLGTNAEIVLYSEKAAFCTSAAAGPCFEGANISCGMSATEGAICGCKLAVGKMFVETIGGTKPLGICGTGLVDVVACLLQSGTIDETGYMECESCEISHDVFINQKDIRQFQLAKSAVISAIKTIMTEQGVGFSQIEKMYISGGFSAKIDVGNAALTGLLPNELKSKCVPINNSSLLGTVKYACEKNNVEGLIKNAKYIDLSCNPTFSELFIENINF